MLQLAEACRLLLVWESLLAEAYRLLLVWVLQLARLLRRRPQLGLSKDPKSRCNGLVASL